MKLLRRDHPANEVFVTGTFDDWGMTVKLDKKDGNLHEKMVELPNASEKIYYKVRMFLGVAFESDHDSFIMSAFSTTSIP